MLSMIILSMPTIGPSTIEISGKVRLLSGVGQLLDPVRSRALLMAFFLASSALGVSVTLRALL